MLRAVATVTIFLAATVSAAESGKLCIGSGTVVDAASCTEQPPEQTRLALLQSADGRRIELGAIAQGAKVLNDSTTVGTVAVTLRSDAPERLQPPLAFVVESGSRVWRWTLAKRRVATIDLAAPAGEYALTVSASQHEPLTQRFRIVEAKRTSLAECVIQMPSSEVSALRA